MPSGTPEEAQAASEKLAADPKFKELLQRVADLDQQYQSTPNQNGARAPYFYQIILAEQAATDYAKSVGALPHDWTFNFNSNNLEKDSFWKRNPWAAALLAGSAAVAAPLAFATIGVGGGTAASSVLPATQTVGPTGALASGGTGLAADAGATGAEVAAGTGGAVTAGEAAANAAENAPDVLPSTQTVPPGGGTLPSGTPSMPPSAFDRPDLYDKITGALKSNWKEILSGGADAVSAATQAAASNRATRDTINERANKDYETALLGREGAEQKERNTALDNVYRNSWYTNRTPGPNNTRGLTPMSADYMATLGNLAQQGNQMLATAPQYGMTSPTIDPLTKFKPSDPSTLEKIGTYAGPIMKVLGTLGKFF